jgi:uncharacterized protein
MQGTLKAPGLYLRGIETPPAPPLESGVTGFVGIAERGPLNSPQPLTGWSDYVDTFGGSVSFGYLADSVFGFFRNGGEKCWVVRVADTSRLGLSTPAGQCTHSEPLAAAGTELTDHNGDPSVRIVALDPGGWGNAVQVRAAESAAPLLRVGVLTQPTTDASMEVFMDSVIDLRPAGSIRITEPDGVSNPTDLVIGAAPAALNATLGRAALDAAVGRVFPIGSVVHAPGLRLEADFRGRREVFDRLSLRADHARYFVPLINGTESVIDYGERRRRRISSLIRVEHLTGAGGESRFPPVVAAPTLEGGGDGFTQARAAFVNAASDPLVTIVATRDRGSAGNGLQVVARPFATLTALPIPDVSGVADRIVVEEIDGFQAGEEVRLGDLANPAVATAIPAVVDEAAQVLQLPGPLPQPHAIGETVAVADRFTLEVRRAGEREPREIIRNVSGDLAAGARFIRTALESESESLCADTPPAPFDTVVQAIGTAPEIELVDGADPGDIDARYYTGYEANGAPFHPPELPPAALVGLATLEAIDDISLVALPDIVRVAAADVMAAQSSVLRHCARMGDRFALLDSPGERAGLTTEAWAAGLGDPTLRRFGAAFHPWVRSTADGAERLTPPSGAVAGLFARSDRMRGVNKAPANERLKGAFGLEPSVDRDRQAVLNPLGVNCVLKLEQGEVRLMGARTLSDDPVARYVNIRRTILNVKKALSRRMLWAVFEPIGPGLYQRLESALSTYLESLLAKGVTASQRTSEAFYVRCNEGTNPAAQARAGTVVAEIGIALLAPAEFIVLTARRTPDAVQVIEEEV